MVKTDSYNNNSKNVKLQKISKGVVNKGAWTADEDRRLSEYIKINGDKKWRSLPARAGLNRCGKSCRLRWLNYLRPDIKRGNISEDEEDLIMRLHNLLGNRWSLIAGRLPGRTDNEIKNYWNTHLSKKSLSISDLNKKIIRRKKHHVSSEPAAIRPAPSEPDASKGKSGGPSLKPWSDLLEKDLDVDMNIELDGFFDFPDFVSNGTEPDSNDKGLENPLGESSSECMYQRMMGPELGNTGDQGCDYQSKFDILDFDMLSRFLDSDMDGGLQIPDQNVSN